MFGPGRCSRHVVAPLLLLVWAARSGECQELVYPMPYSVMIDPSPVSHTEFYYGTVLQHAYLVFFMQLGFVALEAGAGRPKNVRNILLKNMVNVMITTLVWWAIGFAFAYGDEAGGFIGVSGFFYGSNSTLERPWLMSAVFAMVCVSIVGGCLAERTQLVAYPVYTVVLAMFVHPLIVNWVWNSASWFHTIASCSVLDFAGGLAVHLVGGTFGVVGAWLCGPRLGRFEDGLVKELPGHDMTFVTLGTFMLWFGWYGFNCGSTYLYGNVGLYGPRRTAVGTTLGASAGGLTALMWAVVRNGNYDLRICCNGVLAGLVAVTSVAGFVEPWAAVIAGTLGGTVYFYSSRLMLRLQIDDPLDSGAVHMANGALSALLVGLFGNPDYLRLAQIDACGGVFYESQGWTQLGMQFLGVTMAVTISGLAAFAVFYTLSRMGLLRVEQTTELAGIDNFEHLELTNRTST